MADCNRQLAGFRIRLGSLLALRYCLRGSLIWTMILAAAVVLLRVTLGTERQRLLAGLLGYVPALAAGIVLAARKTPSMPALRAALDRHARLGGLLMTAGERDLGPWAPRMPGVSLPAVRLHAGRQGMLLAAGIAFLAAAFLIPDRYLPAAAESLEVGAQIEQLAAKIEVLKQEQLMPPDQAQVVEKDLERVRREASGKEPAKTLEAMDHLEASLSKAAAEAAEAAVKHAEAATKAEDLANALEEVKAQMAPEQLSEAMKELARLTDQAAAENKSLADRLDKKLAEACREGHLTSDDLKKLAGALAKCKQCERMKLEKMVQGRLADAAELARMAKALEGHEAELAEALGKCSSGEDLDACLAALAGGDPADRIDDADRVDEDASMPGRGGRGGGPPTAMSWSKGANQENVAFKEKVLSPAAVASLKDSRLVGVSTGDPGDAKPGGASVGGALAAARAGGGAARTQLILPQHEQAIRRYFEREEKKP
jgi:bacterioferritin-associated ferredoxin